MRIIFHYASNEHEYDVDYPPRIGEIVYSIQLGTHTIYRVTSVTHNLDRNIHHVYVEKSAGV